MTEHSVSDYVLQVHYGEQDPPVRIPLRGVTADDAEVRRQALVTELEHAREIEAPLVYSDATVAAPEAGVPLDPTRVTGVDLVAPFPDEV